MIFPNSFENKIDFKKIRTFLKDYCLSSIGAELVDNMQLITKHNSITSHLQQTNEFKNILESDDDFPTENYFDIRPALNKITVSGAFFEVKELFQLYKSQQTVKAIIRFFEKEETAQKYPRLKTIANSTKVYPYINQGIEKILTTQGKIKDNASPELAKIRQEKAAKQSSVSKTINHIIAQAQKDGWIEEDATLVIRDGRPVIPVTASFKRKISGIIHSESATGKTCYIEPTPVVEINNRLAELDAEEQREIIQILKTFTNNIRPYINDLTDNITLLGIMDFIRSKAKFAVNTHSNLPKISNKQVINWKNATHPILYLSFTQENRTVVPLNINLNNTHRILLISGPNAGGKSVCLKTVGLLQYMLQCGMLIPVDKESEAGIFSNIFIDIGDEQSIENDLSTYSSHLLNMKFFAKNTNNQTLVLIDEFGTGTEPMLGGAIAEAVLNKLNQKETFGVITTHYTNLKHFASTQQGIINGAMLYDSQKLEPLFMLETGKPGSSFAFEIAHKIGLPQDIIDNAKTKIGEDHVNFDKHLKEILRDKNYWERKRQNIRKVERRLEEMLEKEKIELEKSKEISKEIKIKAENEAKQILADSNKIIENTIRQIKESQAEKEKTKLARQELDRFKNKVEKPKTKEDEKIENKIKKLLEREKKLNQKKHTNNKPEEKKEKPEILRKNSFTIGMPVKIQGQKSIGEIIELTNKNAVVAFGNLLTTISVDKLESLNNNEKRTIRQSTKAASNFKQSYEMNNRRMAFKPGLDIRGKRADEAIKSVSNFIDEAIMFNIGEVKILHGKGNGILRQLIRDYLSTVDMVKNFKDEQVEFGGAGITVVNIG